MPYASGTSFAEGGMGGGEGGEEGGEEGGGREVQERGREGRDEVEGDRGGGRRGRRMSELESICPLCSSQGSSI